MAKTQKGAIVIGLVSVLILIIWETKSIKRNKILSAIPSPLLVVTARVLLNEYFYYLDQEVISGIWEKASNWYLTAHDVPTEIPVNETILAEVDVSNGILNPKINEIKEVLKTKPKYISNDHLVSIPEVSGLNEYLSLFKPPLLERLELI